MIKKEDKTNKFRRTANCNCQVCGEPMYVCPSQVKSQTTFTESSIQDAFPGQPGDLAVIPNCAALGYESDLLRVTNNWNVFEYEIKISRADFRADVKKHHRQHLMEALERGNSDELKYWPNRLIYLAPVGVIPHEEVPKWAGLMECEKTESGYTVFRTVKRGRRIHDEPISERALAYVLRGLSVRYWKTRIETKSERNKL